MPPECFYLDRGALINMTLRYQGRMIVSEIYAETALNLINLSCFQFIYRFYLELG